MPIPNVVVPSEPIDFSTLPATVPLSSAGSTVSGAAAYNWFLIEKPDGSTAEISDPNDENPDLINVDVRGTYIVFLSITDTTGSSHPAPYPTQATVPPYRFTNPLASAFGVIRVAEESGLIKPGRGEFGWLESVWALIDKAGETGWPSIQVDEITPYTAGGGIEISTAPDAPISLLADGGDTKIVLDPNSLSGDAIRVHSARADSNISIEADGSIKLETSSGPVDVSTAGKIISFTPDTSVLTSGAPSITSNDAEGIVVSASAYPSSIVHLSESVYISGADNIDLVAAGTSGGAGLTGNAVASVTAVSDNGVVSISATGDGGIIQLNPDAHTITSKPLRAPGVAGTATAFYDPRIPLPANGSALLFSGNPASPRYTNATRFTRHVPGSEVRMELSLVGTFNTTDDHIDLEIVAREASGINSFVLQVMPNNQLKLGVDAVIRLTPLSATRLMRVVTLNTFNPDTNHPNAGLGDVVVCDVVTYSQASLMAVMTYDMTLYDGGAGVSSYAATLVSSLTNPHTQDVL
jgi:hypothetical protein